MKKQKLFLFFLLIISLSGCFGGGLNKKKTIDVSKEVKKEDQSNNKNIKTDNSLDENLSLTEKDSCETKESPTPDDYITSDKLEKLLDKNNSGLVSRDLRNFVCPKTINCATGEKKIINKENRIKQYNIIDGCLYADEERVFKYNLLAYSEAGFFGDDYIKIEDVNSSMRSGMGEFVQETFRFEDSNKLYIFLSGGAGCGGCISSGPYLEIDLLSGKINGKETDISYRSDSFLSPDNKVVINSSYEYDSDFNIKNETLLLSNFITAKSELIFTLPTDKTITDIDVGFGSFSIENSVRWLDNNTIQVQLYEKSKDGVERGLKSGDPITIKIKRD